MDLTLYILKVECKYINNYRALQRTSYTAKTSWYSGESQLNVKSNTSKMSFHFMHHKVNLTGPVKQLIRKVHSIVVQFKCECNRRSLNLKWIIKLHNRQLFFSLVEPDSKISFIKCINRINFSDQQYNTIFTFPRLNKIG